MICAQDSVRLALAHVSPEDREQWIRMGMAVKAEIGEAGFDLWDQWSQQAERAYRAADARSVWRSIKPGGGVTIATLYYEAKRRGFRLGEHRVPAPSAAELEQRAQEARQAATDAERRRAWAARRAAGIWAEAGPARADHPYLVRKRVAPVETLREIDAGRVAEVLHYRPKAGDAHLSGRLLVAPVVADGKFSTLEMIEEAGLKSAIAGGAKARGYWSAQMLPTDDGAGVTFLVGEGVATVLTAREATGHLGIASLSCWNLPDVARVMRETYPAAAFVILADIGNGEAKAIDAARAVDGALAVPQFPLGCPQGAKDFNDLARAIPDRGDAMAAVRKCIAAGKRP